MIYIDISKVGILCNQDSMSIIMKERFSDLTCNSFVLYVSYTNVITNQNQTLSGLYNLLHITAFYYIYYLTQSQCYGLILSIRIRKESFTIDIKSTIIVSTA